MLVYSIKGTNMSISPELTKDFFEFMYANMLKEDVEKKYKFKIQSFNEILDQIKAVKEVMPEEFSNHIEEFEKQELVTNKLKYTVLVELKMIDYIKNNNPDMVLKLINKILENMNEVMEIGQTVNDDVYFNCCDMAKTDYNRMEKFKILLETLQS